MAYRLKNRGIRKPSDLPLGLVVPPKFGGPPCCRGSDMCGFMRWDIECFPRR